MWRKYYRPLPISERLTVLPAWESVSDTREGLFIRIDPGPAFGTGEHPTTRMCLKAIEECTPPGAWSMLDVGAGSGILDMMPHFSRVVAPGGRLILSGLLEGQSAAVKPALERAGFKDLRISQEEEWVCVTGIKTEEWKDGMVE